MGGGDVSGWIDRLGGYRGLARRQMGGRYVVGFLLLSSLKFLLLLERNTRALKWWVSLSFSDGKRNIPYVGTITAVGEV